MITNYNGVRQCLCHHSLTRSLRPRLIRRRRDDVKDLFIVRATRSEDDALSEVVRGEGSGEEGLLPGLGLFFVAADGGDEDLGVCHAGGDLGHTEGGL